MADQKQSIGERRLGAIMFTDVVGYSSMTSKNEETALRLLEEHKKLLGSAFSKFNGRVVKSTGDGFLVEFASAVDAVNCAVEAQKEMGRFNQGRREGESVLVRIGIHVGDVFHSGGDVLGDAVNVAARVQPLAEPGGICVTRQVLDQVERKVGYRMVRIGAHELKNIGYAVEVYKVALPTESSGAVSSSLDPRRVAILPFANMSPDPNDRYFADGMTEELISTVSKIGELQVISRTSVMRYRDTILPLTQIGEELSAGSVLEGSVRKAGNKVRITAQLIEVKNDKHLWSQSYDRDLTDVFAVQADIAEQVAGSLKVRLVPHETESVRKQATANPEAHTLYLKGRFYWNERTEEATKKALSYFESAAKLDPSFALVYSGTADCYNILSDYGWMPPDQAMPLAKSNAVRALELDDSLAEAHASLGLTLEAFFWDFAAAEREFKRAIELKPNYAPVYHWYAVLLFNLRRYEQADAIDARALELDPYSPIVIMANAIRVVGDCLDGNLEKLDNLQVTNPDFGAVHLWKSVILACKSEHAAAIAEAKRFVEIDSGSWNSKLNLARVYALTGRGSEAESLLEEAVSASEKTFVPPAEIGAIFLALGRMDEGYAWLDKALKVRDPTLLDFNGSPMSKKFMADSRWMEIARKAGF